MRLGNFLFFIFFIVLVSLLVPAVSAKVYINEVYPAGNAIELYSDALEDLSGWKLISDDAHGLVEINEGVVIEAGEHKLFANFKSSNAEEKVILYNAGGVIEDTFKFDYDNYPAEWGGEIPAAYGIGRYPDKENKLWGFKYVSLGEKNFNAKIDTDAEDTYQEYSGEEIYADTPIMFKTKVYSNDIPGYPVEVKFGYKTDGYLYSDAEKISDHSYQYAKDKWWKNSLIEWKFLVYSGGLKEGESLPVIFSVKNSPPEMKNSLPNLVFNEEGNWMIYLFSYFFDADTEDKLTYFLNSPNLEMEVNSLGSIATITGKKDYFGEETWKITAFDGESGIEVPIKIKVNNINDPPAALGQEINIAEDTEVEIVLSATDVDTTPLTYTLVDSPQKGTLSGSGQIVTYTPNLEASGVDTFTFLVDDGQYASAPATVTINIAAVADAPKFNLDSFNVEMYEDGLKVVGLNNYLTDEDTPLNDLTFNYNGDYEPWLDLKLDEAKNELYITPLVKDWSGEKKVFLTVFDVGGVLSDTAEMSVKVNQLKDDAPVISAVYPFDDVAIGEDKSQEFKLELSDPDSINPKFEWYVDGKKQSDVDNTFVFDAKKYSVNEHKVKGKVVGYAQEKEWKVKLVDKPVFDEFNGATTDLSKLNQAQLKSVNLVLEKLGYGKIVFDNPVDLTEILDLNNAVEIGSNLVAVDKVNAPSLNVPATITLYDVKFNNPIVLSYEGFTKDASLANALCSDCQIVSKEADSITFKTKHFSTMKLGESTSLQLNVPSAVSFEEGERGATVTAQFEIVNAGTSVLSNLKISSTAAIQYGAIFSLDGVTYSNTVTLNSLSVGAIKPIFVKATVPANIDSGWQDIGDILIVDTTLSKTISGFYLKAKDYLTINEIKVNGKTDGELVPGKTNEIKLTVENVLGDGDLENIDITATLLDVNKEDLDEEKSSFDLKSGASKKVSFEFELPYNLEEGSYELEIEAVGETKEGAEIEMTRTFEIDVKREGHQITISAVKSLPAKVDLCDDKTVLIEAELVNIGNTAEKDLTLKLQNGGKVLGEKSGLLLEKYTGKASQTAAFEIETSKLKEGKSIFTLELFNSKNNFDAKEFVLEIEKCAKKEIIEKKVEVNENILPAVSDAGSKSKQKITGSTVLTVRNTREYLVLVLLGIVVLGGIILLLLGLYTFRRK